MVAKRSRRDRRTIRGFILASVVAALAAVASWCLHDVVSGVQGLSQGSLERDLTLTKQGLAQEREKSKQLDRQLAGALRQVAVQAAAVGDAAALKQELTDLR